MLCLNLSAIVLVGYIGRLLLTLFEVMVDPEILGEDRLLEKEEEGGKEEEK